jgi:hypothetical protein
MKRAYQVSSPPPSLPSSPSQNPISTQALSTPTPTFLIKAYKRDFDGKNNEEETVTCAKYSSLEEAKKFRTKRAEEWDNHEDWRAVVDEYGMWMEVRREWEGIKRVRRWFINIIDEEGNGNGDR